MQKKQRTRGATLSLIAIFALVIILVGLAFFIIIKQFGGSREAANVTDAGVLNVAKQALVKYGVPGGQDFRECAIPSGGPITLNTYNRCIAQTLLVCMNAETEKSETAKNNAQILKARVQKLGVELARMFSDLSYLGDDFNSMAAANNIKLLGSPTLSAIDLANAYMNAGFATNVYFNPQSMPKQDWQGNPYEAPKLPESKGVLKSSAGYAYLAGYVPIKLDGVTLYGVPVNPQQSPHLVSLTDFNAQLKAPEKDIPPNAFRVDAQCKDVHSGVNLHTIAAAIVGSISDVSSDSRDFPASIPGGYIEIVNLPALAVDSQWETCFNANLSIFNREIYDGLEASSNGCFSTADGEVPAWIAYNNSVGSDSNGHDGALYPPGLGFDDPQNPTKKTLRKGSGYGQLATLSEALEIKDYVKCDPAKYDYTHKGTCASVFSDLCSNYGRTIKNLRAEIRKEGYMNVEIAKAQCLDAFDKLKQWYADIEPPQTEPTGLLVFDRDKYYPIPDWKVDDLGNTIMDEEDRDFGFGRVGTIEELLKQSTTCPDRIIGEMFQRCNQIVPGTKKDDFEALLKTKLPMGEPNGDKPYELYIYKSSNKLAISQTKPPGYTGEKPDGDDPFGLSYPPLGAIPCYQIKYRADGHLVNTSNSMRKVIDKKTGQVRYVPILGDGGTNQALFLRLESPRGTIWSSGLMSIDRARWRLSSGYGNLLGRLEFSNQFAGRDDEHYPGEKTSVGYTFTNPN